MVDERCAGAVTCYLRDGKPKYLLLHYEEGYWGFPKGHIERGENEQQAALRELAEETGIQHVFLLHGFQGFNKYYFSRGGETIYKEVVYFLAESPAKDVIISDEHIGFRWLPFDMAIKAITFPNDKDILTKADHWMKTKRPTSGGSFSGHALVGKET